MITNHVCVRVAAHVPGGQRGSNAALVAFAFHRIRTLVAAQSQLLVPPNASSASCVLQVDWAVSTHDRLLVNVQQFFQQYDLLACPTVMMPPFDASIP